MPPFTPSLFRIRTAVKVTSEPVPAVVGIMIVGTPGLGTRFSP